MKLKFSSLGKIFLSLVGVIISTWSLFLSQVLSKSEHLVYFPNKPYELNNYKIMRRRSLAEACQHRLSEGGVPVVPGYRFSMSTFR